MSTANTTTTTNPTGTGLHFERIFSSGRVNPYDQITWERRTAEILGSDGAPVFRQEDVEVPESWSQRATAIVFDKYAYGRLGTPERETSVRQIVGRVVDTIADFGWRHGYFPSAADHDAFHDELSWLLLNQHAAFNSPVWFNVGCRPGTGYAWDFDRADVARCSEIAGPRYTGSACYIISTKDEIGIVDDPDGVGSIARNVAVEMNVFKYGSGAGSNRSRLRSSREPVTGGGRASGPVSFMRIYDAVGAVTKSGGIARRAAKMEILNCNHPDILEFIRCKHHEERKAKILIASGYEADFNGEAYNSVLFQNSNLSVRAADAFLAAVEDDASWQTISVVTSEPRAADGTLMPLYRARELMDAIAEGAWHCGDPGMQYDDTIQKWHTTPNAGYLHASNPCSEYMSLDDSACNLASLNLMKFRREDGAFDVERFRAACRIFAVAQDILVDLGSYPTPEIARNAHRFRQLGLGYTNLGSLIMAAGLPYDSAVGRGLAGAITAIMTGQVYLTSAELAAILGPFEGFAADRGDMLRVMGMHRDAAYDLIGSLTPRMAHDHPVLSGLTAEACRVWDVVVSKGSRNGYRNAQATVLAPTGTISFMMDADTTGIEPAIALVSYKALWGRGRMKLVNETVPVALKALGYDDSDRTGIETFIADHDTIEGSSLLKPEHLPVFDCAFPPPKGTRSISWRGHLEMMAAVQPFLSGAISKTINMPRNSTIGDVRDAYLAGWKLGLKAVAIYRDGSKESQPVSTSRPGTSEEARDGSGVLPGVDRSRRRPDGPLAPPDGGPDPEDGGGTPGSPGRGGSFLGDLRPGGGPAPGPGTVSPRRERLPDTRRSLTHKFSIQGHEGYVTVGFYPDGRPGELFLTMAKEGSTIGGLVDTIGTLVSLGLQYGVPLEILVAKFAHQRFEPSGFTRNPDIPIARSVTDYIFRWMGMEFVSGYRALHAPKRAAMPSPSNGASAGGDSAGGGPPVLDPVVDGTTCQECGYLMVQRIGPCFVCSNCGSTSGGCN